MKKQNVIYFLFFVTSLIIYTSGFGQDYHTGLGIRLGLSNGITVKHFITTDDAVEGILTARWNGFNITGLYERHLPVFDTEGFYFLYGGGVHFGIWDAQKFDPDSDKSGNQFFLGIDGILGLEYVFADVPLSLGLDWKPGFNMVSRFGLTYDEIALSVRYLFK